MLKSVDSLSIKPLSVDSLTVHPLSADLLSLHPHSAFAPDVNFLRMQNTTELNTMQSNSFEDDAARTELLEALSEEAIALRDEARVLLLRRRELLFRRENLLRASS